MFKWKGNDESWQAIKELTKQNFDKEVLNAEGGSVLVDFWAPWCGPCRMQGPVVEKLAEGGYSVAKVNIDEQPELAEQYRVMSHTDAHCL